MGVRLVINPPISQRIADSYVRYLSAQRMDDQAAAWSVFRALCKKEQKDPVDTAKQLNPWKKS